MIKVPDIIIEALRCSCQVVHDSLKNVCGWIRASLFPGISPLPNTQPRSGTKEHLCIDYN